MYEAMRLAPQGPGLFRRTRAECRIAEGTHHETRLPAGTLTFAATQSAMLDDDVIDDPDDFRTNRPAHHYLHFGVGLHECFGRFANAMQIPLIAKAVLRQEGLERAGELVKAGPFPASLDVRFEAR
jgi:cytochrome P450